MIYWKRTDVFGFPEPNAPVLVWHLDSPWLGRLIMRDEVPYWEVDSRIGDNADVLPLPEITHWSETNAPWTR